MPTCRLSATSLVEPARAPVEKVAAAGGEVRIAAVAGHFFSSAQSGQIPEAHLRVGAVVFDIHGVVLAALHHAVLVGVPAAFDPAEFERFFHPGVELLQKSVVARELPVAVDLDHAAHLTVGGGLAEIEGAAQGQRDAEAHHAVWAQGVEEFDFAHRAGEVAKEEGGGLLVVPDVGAGP